MGAWIWPMVGRLNSPGCKKDHVDGVSFPMSNASTTQTGPADVHDVQKVSGHGRHRGPVSAHDSETAPRGRHRKPVEETETAA
ncbi:hypothetical protein GCM10022233_18980 [Streptomyces shaanxiensis]|uniref:Uncharacterized protein n=1 Tax=Streptomyces shaanxiensis TaxID=653357 RepID=A0ABP7UP69_9ACTN